MTISLSSSATVAMIEPAFLQGGEAGLSRLPGRLLRHDLRGVRPGPAPVHRPVPAAAAAPVRRPLRRHRAFGRDLEAAGRARATITRRLSTIAGLYRYTVEEDLLDRSPTVHVRRPRIDYESHATGLDRNEVGAMLVAAELGTAAEHALISLLALKVVTGIAALLAGSGFRRQRRSLFPRARSRNRGDAVTRDRGGHAAITG